MEKDFKLIINSAVGVSKKGTNYNYGAVKLVRCDGKELEFKDYNYILLDTFEYEFNKEEVDLSSNILEIGVYQVPWQPKNCIKMFIQSLKK